MRRYSRRAQNHELSAAAMPGRNSPVALSTLKSNSRDAYCPLRVAFLLLPIYTRERANLVGVHFLQFESARCILTERIIALQKANLPPIFHHVQLNLYTAKHSRRIDSLAFQYYASSAFSEYIPMLKCCSALL